MSSTGALSPSMGSASEVSLDFQAYWPGIEATSEVFTDSVKKVTEIIFLGENTEIIKKLLVQARKLMEGYLSKQKVKARMNERLFPLTMCTSHKL